MMAGILTEPHTMAIARTPEELRCRSHSEDENNIDYRKIPRSSGDGMEHSGNRTEHKIYPQNILLTNHGHVSQEDGHVFMHTVGRHGQEQKSKLPQTSDVQEFNGYHTRKTVHKIENDYNHFKAVHQRKDLPDISLVVQDNGKKPAAKIVTCTLKEQQVDTVTLDSDLTISMLSDIDHQVPDNRTFNTITDEHIEGISINKDYNQKYSCSEMKNMIKGLEERNSKLVEEKTKLCVQLGLQTQVNADIKKLLVAAVGNDLDNSLEAILMKNAQSAVEVRHWKTLSEEYAEESDKLAIECDVWRTKFMASRMMSDELSTWKTTLYTKYKQMQNALQRILNERAELKKHLAMTKRLLHSLGHVIKANNISCKKAETLNEAYITQSVLELASVISCLVHDLTVQLQDERNSSSIPAETLSLTIEAEKQNVEPTPAEKLAIQILSSEVELHTEEQQEKSTVMKRMGKQYIGNSYHSRLMTNSFRVTFDCCNRCKGPVQVV